MGLASVERANAAAGKGCLGKAHDDEPVFILRAQDSLAADLVELWAIRAKTLMNDPASQKSSLWDKIHDAEQLADAMRRWPIRKNPD